MILLKKMHFAFKIQFYLRLNSHAVMLISYPLAPPLERILTLRYLRVQSITNGLIIILFEKHCNDLVLLLYVTCVCVKNTSFCLFVLKNTFVKLPFVM